MNQDHSGLQTNDEGLDEPLPPSYEEAIQHQRRPGPSYSLNDEIQSSDGDDDENEGHDEDRARNESYRGTGTPSSTHGQQSTVPSASVEEEQYHGQRHPRRYLLQPQSIQRTHPLVSFNVPITEPHSAPIAEPSAPPGPASASPSSDPQLEAAAAAESLSSPSAGMPTSIGPTPTFPPGPAYIPGFASNSFPMGPQHLFSGGPGGFAAGFGGFGGMHPPGGFFRPPRPGGFSGGGPFPSGFSLPPFMMRPPPPNTDYSWPLLPSTPQPPPASMPPIPYSPFEDHRIPKGDTMMKDEKPHIPPPPASLPVTAVPSAPLSPYLAEESEIHGTSEASEASGVLGVSGSSASASTSFSRPATEGRASGAGSRESVLPGSQSEPLDRTPNAQEFVNAPDISEAAFTRSRNGVQSMDKILEDPFQLYRFFVAHNDRPSMHVLITGSHVEKRSSEERNDDGTIKVVYQNSKVNDFKIVLDLTQYISASGTLMTLPDPKTGKSPTLREVMEEHVDDDNPFKLLHMEKKVLWEYEDLTRSIIHAIRSVNYRYTIEISYPIINNRVEVYSASPLSTLMMSGWTKLLYAMSIVGLAIYPLREMYKKIKDKSLQSEFQMTISTREFCDINYWTIIDQVQFK